MEYNTIKAYESVESVIVCLIQWQCFEASTKLHLESVSPHACDMSLHELFALLGGFGRLEAQEAIVTR